MTSTARGRIAVGVATELLILLPLAGAASGVYWAFQLLSAESRVGEWAAVLAAVVVFGLVAAGSGRANQRCTHGVSSIGPVIIENGKVVGGDTTPHTDACLP